MKDQMEPTADPDDGARRTVKAIAADLVRRFGSTEPMPIGFEILLARLDAADRHEKT